MGGCFLPLLKRTAGLTCRCHLSIQDAMVVRWVCSLFIMVLCTLDELEIAVSSAYARSSVEILGCRPYIGFKQEGGMA